MLRTYLDLPRSVHILCLGQFINRAGTLVVPFMTVYIQKDRGLGIEFATQAMGLYGLGAMVAVLAGGHLADHIGRRVVMLAGLLGGAAMILVFSMLTAPWAMMAAIVALAVLGEMYRPAASAMIGDLVPAERRQHAYGLMYVSVNLGFAIGPLIAGTLARRSFSYLFWGDALTSAVYAAIILALIRETLPRRSVGPAGSSGATRPDVPQARATARGSGMAHILRDRVFMIFWLGNLCIGLVIMQSMSTFPLYIQQLGFGPEIYGRTIAVNGILIVLLQIPTTALLARFNRAGVLVAAAVVTAIGFGLTGLAATPWQLAATVVIWTLGEIMQAPLMPTIVNDLAPPELRARYFGALSMAFSCANMLGAPLGGLVLANVGGAALWMQCFAVAMTAATLFLLVHRRIGRPVV